MNKKLTNPMILGTLILTGSGLLARLMGFFYRIYLSRLLGSEGMGVYQLIMPVSGICFGLCCGPVQTALSRFTAAAPVHKRRYFFSALLICLFFSFTLSFTLFRYSDFLAADILEEPRTADLLKLLALSIPLSAAHAAVNGYYYGSRKTAVPAASQILEQLARIASVFLLASWLNKHGYTLTPVIAVFGLLIGECISVLFSASAVTLSLTRRKLPAPSVNTPSVPLCIREILTMAAPLMANRFILGLLQSYEAIQIPQKLVSYGLSSSKSLSLYGTLTGMAFPFIMFPSAITGSLAVMLLPTVAHAKADGQQKQLISTAETVISYSIYMGVLCTGLFASCGSSLGLIFFKSGQAGSFIGILGWLCPFLYLITTVSGILNGLGYTLVTFLMNLSGLILQLAGVLFFVPRCGIKAYLISLLLSQILTSFLSLLFLRRQIPFGCHAFRHILRPTASIILAGWCSRNILRLFSVSDTVSLLTLSLQIFLTSALYILFLLSSGGGRSFALLSSSLQKNR